ncbi:MAG: hypothetical protein EOP51_04005 [Sphingobacteriales bacterium]|nr:MAG: hypothetical protein EOP51_04005 [Sphingobacteriales bacterium]
MQSNDFEDLACFIMSKNTFFQDGYANACRDEISNAIYVHNGNERKIVLPNDKMGNYFYMRNEAGITYEALPAERLSDSNAQRLSFLDTQVVQLVAIVQHADAYRLAELLRNTCMMYEEMNVQPVSATINREQVLLEEMPKMKADDMHSALQRLKHETIVRLTLRISKLFIPGNCITNPCQN